MNREEVDDSHLNREHCVTVSQPMSQELSPRGQEARYRLPQGVISNREQHVNLTINNDCSDQESVNEPLSEVVLTQS